jgi:hypothetical protein
MGGKRSSTAVWLLAAALGLAGCASRTSAPGLRRDLSYARYSAGETGAAEDLSDEPPRSSSPLASRDDAEVAQRAVLSAAASVKGSMDNSASALSKLAARPLWRLRPHRPVIRT